MVRKRQAFGERITDNLMEKLAEKISAQEMIRANEAAQAAEAERVRQRAAQYEKEMEEIDARAADLEQRLTDIEKRLKDDSNKTHDIGVQIYRNVQASVRTDLTKNSEELMTRIAADNDRLASVVSRETAGAVERALEGNESALENTENTIRELRARVDALSGRTWIMVLACLFAAAACVLEIIQMLGLNIFR